MLSELVHRTSLSRCQYKSCVCWMPGFEICFFALLPCQFAHDPPITTVPLFICPSLWHFLRIFWLYCSLYFDKEIKRLQKFNGNTWTAGYSFSLLDKFLRLLRLKPWLPDIAPLHSVINKTRVRWEIKWQRWPTEMFVVANYKKQRRHYSSTWKKEPKMTEEQLPMQWSFVLTKHCRHSQTLTQLTQFDSPWVNVCLDVFEKN